jgi:Protein of unknown function (DUF1553)/Protein of unknown function (DUF1549)
MLKSLLCTAVLTAALASAGTGTAFLPTFESHAALTPECRIDELVFGKLKQLGIQPAYLCSDSVFLRRVYLDVTGTLPTVKETEQFLADKDPNKRAALIDRLLERDEFADYWTLKWSDLLRIKAEFPINLWPEAAEAYHHWVWESIRANKPYDQFVREMLTSNGSNFRVPPVNFYRAMQNRDPSGIAQTVALTFMGTRAEKWPKERLAGMADFFSNIGYKGTGEWKEQIVFFDPDKPAATTPAPNTAPDAPSQPALSAPPPKAAFPTMGTFPDGTQVRLSPDRDPREVFADWLISAKNPWFSRNIVNRVWSWLLGRGIIQEPDDIRPDNPPSNPELLAYLEQELVKSHYDLKHIYRLILNSKTYQLSSIPRTGNPAGAVNFAYYPLRRLDAEVLIDALGQITGTSEEYSSAIPERFTFINQGQRSVTLPDGSITSSFLELFGRPSRDTGTESERTNRPSADQRLYFLNSTHIEQKLEQGPKLQYIIRNTKDPKALVNTLYLMILSRFPTDDELKTIEAYSRSGVVRGRETTVDLAWALINSAEFLYRH